MPNTTQKFEFPNGRGQTLAGRLELPKAQPVACAIFAHCFTCSKDIAAATRIARGLTQYGVAVLRFDFTGLGNSDGDFANENFSSNKADLLAAAAELEKTYMAPSLLIGHSLGGAAVLAAAIELPELKAVATIGAPSEVGHVAHLFDGHIDEIEAKGEADVNLAGRKFNIKKQFLEDIKQVEIGDNIHGMKKALLVMHSPQDDTVSIDHARKIYEKAMHPKSFVTLDGADHLLTRKQDSEYVASVIAAWAKRYLPEQLSSNEKVQKSLAPNEVFIRSRQNEKLTHDVYTKEHHFVADEPVKVGGADLGMTPYDLLLAALGTCTSMTIKMYAAHKGWPVEAVDVTLTHEKIHAKDCEDCETEKGKVDEIKRTIKVYGDLSEEQRSRILEIADKCPVHKTLHNEVKVRSELGE